MDWAERRKRKEEEGEKEGVEVGWGGGAAGRPGSAGWFPSQSAIGRGERVEGTLEKNFLFFFCMGRVNSCVPIERLEFGSQLSRGYK